MAHDTAAHGFDEWYRANARHIVAVVSIVTRDQDVAVDAVAEACARAFARWDRLALGNASGWTYVVALRVARRAQRRRAREDHHLRSEGTSQQSNSPADHDDVLWALVGDLPERMRLAVALRYVGDLSEQQVADVMGISRSGTAALLTKARAALRTALVETRNSE